MKMMDYGFRMSRNIVSAQKTASMNNSFSEFERLKDYNLGFFSPQEVGGLNLSFKKGLKF